MKLFVAGLPNDFDDIDLKEMFELYGEVKSAKLVIDRATGKSKGFGFVDMPNKTEAQETIDALDGANIKRKQIVVKEAEEQTRNTGFGTNRPPNRPPNRRF
jgi:RNA recognition motif-containing protein